MCKYIWNVIFKYAKSCSACIDFLHRCTAAISTFVMHVFTYVDANFMVYVHLLRRTCTCILTLTLQDSPPSMHAENPKQPEVSKLKTNADKL
jgi:hypothetical protein